jgi:hypothetical protein
MAWLDGCAQRSQEMNVAVMLQRELTDCMPGWTCRDIQQRRGSREDCQRGWEPLVRCSWPKHHDQVCRVAVQQCCAFKQCVAAHAWVSRCLEGLHAYRHVLLHVSQQHPQGGITQQ